MLQLRMSSLPAVEDLDVIEYGVREIESCSRFLPIEELDLHAGPERFHHGIVITIAVGLGLGLNLAIFTGGVFSAITISRSDRMSLPAMMVAPAIIAFPIAAVERRVAFPVGR